MEKSEPALWRAPALPVPRTSPWVPIPAMEQGGSDVAHPHRAAGSDGGLLSRGHPLGPTGLAQIWETVVQLRGQAGARQVDGARTGLIQLIGAGNVCLIHILQRV